MVSLEPRCATAPDPLCLRRTDLAFTGQRVASRRNHTHTPGKEQRDIPSGVLQPACLIRCRLAPLESLRQTRSKPLFVRLAFCYSDTVACKITRECSSSMPTVWSLTQAQRGKLIELPLTTESVAFVVAQRLESNSTVRLGLGANVCPIGILHTDITQPAPKVVFLPAIALSITFLVLSNCVSTASVTRGDTCRSSRRRNVP